MEFKLLRSWKTPNGLLFVQPSIVHNNSVISVLEGSRDTQPSERKRWIWMWPLESDLKAKKKILLPSPVVKVLSFDAERILVVYEKKISLCSSEFEVIVENIEFRYVNLKCNDEPL
jgi:hypothetical protein